MNGTGIMTVKEWLFDKINDELKSCGSMVRGTYKIENGLSMLDHTKLYVINIERETEKAVCVRLDSETFGGHYCERCAWIPKSAIVAFEQ